MTAQLISCEECGDYLPTLIFNPRANALFCSRCNNRWNDIHPPQAQPHRFAGTPT